MVSSIVPISSTIVDCHSAELKLCDDNHWFSTTRCSTCCFIATSSLLSLELSFSKYSDLYYAAIAHATFVAITALRFHLVLKVITFSIATDTGFWGLLGKYLCLYYMILFFSWSNFTLQTYVNISAGGGVISISPNGRCPLWVVVHLEYWDHHPCNAWHLLNHMAPWFDCSYSILCVASSS